MDRMRQSQAAASCRMSFRCLPPEAPLAMPVQRLRGATEAARAVLQRPRRLALRRIFIFGATIAMTGLAGVEMYLVLSVGGLTVLEGIVLGLFVLLFAWIGLSFVSSFAGFVLELAGPARDLGIDPATPLPAVATRSALLLPTYNEDPGHVMARLQAIHQSVQDTG